MRRLSCYGPDVSKHRPRALLNLVVKVEFHEGISPFFPLNTGAAYGPMDVDSVAPDSASVGPPFGWRIVKANTLRLA